MSSQGASQNPFTGSLACFFIDKADEGVWVGHPALEGGKLLCCRCTEVEGQPLKIVEVIER